MTSLSAALNPMGSNNSKKKFYITEILMLKSIIALLVLTFFLLSEMQASNKETRQLKREFVNKKIEIENSTVLSGN